MTTKSRAAIIDKATEAANTCYIIIRQFERGRISLREMHEALMREAARHKYSPAYVEAAAEAISARSAREYKATMTAAIQRTAEA